MRELFDLSNYSFSPYALPVLLVGATSACLGLVAVIWERRSPVSLAFCAMAWSVAIWLLSFGPVYSTHDSSVALAWVKVEHLGVVFIPTTVYVFTLAVVGRLRSMWLLAWASVALSGLFYLGVVFGDWFLVGVDRYFWGYYPTYGPLIAPFLAFFFSLMVVSFRLYWVGQRGASSWTQRGRQRTMLLALGVAYLASMDYLGGFGIPVYPFGYLFIGAFVLMAAQAIWRYRLVDITPSFAARQITETMADALLVLDQQGVIHVANRAASELFGYAREDLIGRPAATIGAIFFADQLEKLNEAGTAGYHEAAYERPEGDTRILSLSASPMCDADGELVAIVCIARDITERKRAEDALRESEGKFRTMAETVAAAVFIFQGSKLRYVNSAAEAMTGYTRDELLTMNFWDVVHPDFRELGKERGLARQRGEDVPSRYEIKLMTKSGEEKWVDFTGGVIEFEGRPAVLGTSFDVTERKWAEAALQEAANHDPLTGLLNRRAGLAAIEARLEHARQTSGLFATFILDLDRFKSINDNFSHETGDAALVQFAQVLVELVGDSGVICRLGGDEFEIAMDGTTLEQALLFAERLQASLRLAQISCDDGQCPQFTVSIGIACYPEDAESIVDLGRHADHAMYAAKAASGDRVQAWRRLRPRRVA